MTETEIEQAVKEICDLPEQRRKTWWDKLSPEQRIILERSRDMLLAEGAAPYTIADQMIKKQKLSVSRQTLVRWIKGAIDE